MKKLLFILAILCQLSTYAQLPNTISNEDKIYGLSKFWQEVNYNFVYLSKIDKDQWDALYRKSIQEVQETENDYEYYRVLQRFCAFLKDGHTDIWMPDTIKQHVYYSSKDNVRYSEFQDIKLQLENIDGKAIIVRINDSKKNEIPIGSEVISVNGLATSDYIEKNVKPYISTSAEHILQDLCIQYLLDGVKGNDLKIEIRDPKGKSKMVELRTGTAQSQMYPPIEKKALLNFNWEDDSIAYLGLNSFSDWDIMDEFSEVKPELNKAKKLIIDLRYNLGGNSAIGRELIKFLTNDKLLYMAKSQSRRHIPAYKAWGNWVKAEDTLNQNYLKDYYLAYHDQLYHDFPYNPYNTSSMNINRIEIPTVILIGHSTASAAEDFLVYANNQEHMIKIGEPTYGSTGQPMVFDLPGGGSARVCTKKDTYPDGNEFVGIGIQPDIYVKKTYNDFMENKDPVLEKAIQHLTGIQGYQKEEVSY